LLIVRALAGDSTITNDFFGLLPPAAFLPSPTWVEPESDFAMLWTP
jgi:hypothetical protein